MLIEICRVRQELTNERMIEELRAKDECANLLLINGGWKFVRMVMGDRMLYSVDAAHMKIVDIRIYEDYSGPGRDSSDDSP